MNPRAYYGDAAYRARYVHMKFLPEAIAAALRRTRGGIAAAARALRCSRTTVQRYLAVYPALRELADEELELALDLAEISLFADAAAGEPKARKFLLLTRGRSRGYVLHKKEVITMTATSLPSSPQRHTTVVMDHDKAAYLAKIRADRDCAGEAPQGSPTNPPAVSASDEGCCNNGNVPS